MVQMTPWGTGHREGEGTESAGSSPLSAQEAAPPPPIRLPPLLVFRATISLPAEAQVMTPQSLPWPACDTSVPGKSRWHEPQKGHLEGRSPQGRLGAGGDKGGGGHVPGGGSSKPAPDTMSKVRLEGGLSWGLGVTEEEVSPGPPAGVIKGWGSRGKQAPTVTAQNDTRTRYGSK